MIRRDPGDFASGYSICSAGGGLGGLVGAAIGGVAPHMVRLLGESVTDRAVPVDQRAHLAGERAIELLAEAPGLRYAGGVEDLADIIPQGRHFGDIVGEVKSATGPHAATRIGTLSLGLSALTVGGQAAGTN